MAKGCLMWKFRRLKSRLESAEGAAGVTEALKQALAGVELSAAAFERAAVRFATAGDALLPDETVDAIRQAVELQVEYLHWRISRGLPAEAGPGLRLDFGFRGPLRL